MLAAERERHLRRNRGKQEQARINENAKCDQTAPQQGTGREMKIRHSHLRCLNSSNTGSTWARQQGEAVKPGEKRAFQSRDFNRGLDKRKGKKGEERYTK